MNNTTFGFLVIDKPVGLTSHDCVSRLRKVYKIKKIGHGGTLDPAVTGVLPIALGKATKLLSLLPSSKDQYEYYLMNIDQIELEINKKDIEEFFYMHYLNIGDGRIEGNNDLFFVRKRDYDPSNKDMFIELIDDASSKKFDCIFDSFSKAIEQVDSRTTD